MELLGASLVNGDMVALMRTDPGHLAAPGVRPSEVGVGTFEGLLLRALDGANSLQLESEYLGQQMIINPDSVDVHDVTIAMAQANLAVSLTKAVVDGALEAYNSIINMR